MPFNRDSLSVIKDRTYADYMSLYRPFDKTVRYNILRILANVDAGMYHQMQGDLDFLSKQIFPDSAEGDYLRAHWSSRVPPQYAVKANGTAIVTGVSGRAVPAGLRFESASGNMYFSDASTYIRDEGFAVVPVKAENAGAESNIAADEKLTIISAIPSGIDSGANGILGGSDSESDEEYLTRVLIALRNPSRYGKKGDYESWAIDSTPEVSNAWEFKNFGIFGELLIQVTNGKQTTGVHQVENLQEVRDYISSVSPPIIFDVRTPNLIPLNPEITLPPMEDTQQNRETAVMRLKIFLQAAAAPGALITAGALRVAIIDGVEITEAAVKLNGDVAGHLQTTLLEYPILGTPSWA